jgi:hypothetical protein
MADNNDSILVPDGILRQTGAISQALAESTRQAVGFSKALQGAGSAFGEMIRGGISFKAAMDRIWREVLKIVLDALKRMVLSGNSSFGELASGLHGVFSGQRRQGGGFLGGILGTVLDFLPALKLFDNPINDTAAVRSGQDLARLLDQGAASVAAGTRNVAPTKSTSIDAPQTITVHVNVEKMADMGDVERVGETMAWIVGKRLRMVPTGG